ncbi:hypothetical protein [Blastococcus sp. TF02A-35]|uniref:hypothetical protein n=1 Tax=Blastococcus sp. TF02A-35 TaxID=2559612 RepID=UPI0010749104|nr:hypothetical protein [Blastococcus sp. TF02A_35]TFV53169.1 hypothetical protein E4P43_02950 [Blastococcus sp. TF02A_35]
MNNRIPRRTATRRPRPRLAPRALTALGTAAGLVLLGAGPAQAYDPPVGVNTSGGTNASDGLAIHYGSEQIQIRREGRGQVYGQMQLPAATTTSGLFNGIYLRVGDTLVGPRHSKVTTTAGDVAQSVEWDSVTATGGSTTGPGAITSLLTWTDPDTARAYEVQLTLGYAATSDDFYTETAQVTVPAGNTETVKLYRSIDTTLNGRDEGAGFASGGSHPVVGVIDDDRTVVEAYRHVSGPVWTGYWSGEYSCMFMDCAEQGFMNRGRDYPTGSAALNPDSLTDNGMGINWDLAQSTGLPTGAAAPAGVQTFRYDLVFTDDLSLAGMPQTITFAPLSDRRLSDGSRQVSATSSSGLPVTFSSWSPWACTVSGNVVTYVAEGQCDVTASAAGNGTYAPATSVIQSFDITADGTTPQAITFPAPTGTPRPGGTVPLAAVSDSGLPVAYLSRTPSVCTVSGSTLTLHAAGTCTVEAQQGGDPTFAAALPVLRDVVVAAPVVAPGGGGAGTPTAVAAPAAVPADAVSPSPARGSAGPLAHTGVELAGLVTLAAGLLAGGLVLVWRARRRPRTR